LSFQISRKSKEEPPMESRKIWSTIALMVVVALFALFGGAASADTTVTNAKVRGLEATATFSLIEGCLATDIVLFAAEALTQTNGSPTTSTEAILGITTSDVCVGGTLDDEVTLSSDVSFSGSTASATLSGTVAVQSIVGSVRDVPVSLTFTGVGDTVRDRSTQRLEDDGTLMIIRHNGSSREADVSGTIDGLNVEFAVGSAQLTSEREATLTVTHD
jgi:hypothetical protein